MEPGRTARDDLQTARRHAERRQQRQHVGLGVERIDALGTAIPVTSDALRPRRAATHGGGLDRLAFGLVGREDLADLEERDIAEARDRHCAARPS